MPVTAVAAVTVVLAAIPTTAAAQVCVGAVKVWLFLEFGTTWGFACGPSEDLHGRSPGGSPADYSRVHQKKKATGLRR